MATSGDLAQALAVLLYQPFPKTDLYGRYLRSASLLNTKGHGRGAAQMTAKDATAWITSLIVDHERGGDFAREVRRVLALPLRPNDCSFYPDKRFVDDLSVKSATTAGECIERLLRDDMLSDRIRLPIEAGRHDIVTLGFDTEGRDLSLTVQGPSHPEVFEAAMFMFRRGPKEQLNVQSSTVVFGHTLLEIAKLLKGA